MYEKFFDNILKRLNNGDDILLEDIEEMFKLKSSMPYECRKIIQDLSILFCQSVIKKFKELDSFLKNEILVKCNNEYKTYLIFKLDQISHYLKIRKIYIK